MHLLESYALNTGLQIRKPHIYDNFVPINQKGRYISFQPFSQASARSYQNWEEVLAILQPLFEKHDIGIVQLGLPNEPLLKGCEDLRGRTSFNQAAYVIKNSILHLGADSFGVHFASGYQKKIVSIYGPLLPSNSGPYWSKEEDVVCIEPVRREGEKPSYAAVEVPKQLDRIKPEDIASSVAKLLNLDLNYNYKSLYLGQEYPAKKIELIPESFLTNWKDLNVDSLILRMDKVFNEDVLIRQLQLSSCSIVTNKAIDLKILKHFKDKILEFVFYVDQDTDPEYFIELRKIGIKFLLLTSLEKNEFDKIKLKYLEVGTIFPKPVGKRESIEGRIKDIDPKNLYYRSARYVVKGQSLYPCFAEIAEQNAVTKTRSDEPMPIIDHPDFWADLASFIILEKTS